MTSEQTLRGNCLCDAVHIYAAPAKRRVVACHCDMCRRWGGGPLLAVDGGNDVRIEGEEHVGAYRSSDWAERAFCKQCGTHLFYRFLATGDHEIPAGLFEEGVDWSFDEEIFVEERPHYYAFANDTEKLTGAEVMDRYQMPPDQGGAG